ncbi:MAG: M48 family metalloprotease [Crocinitomicaceae bacterium]|nr:M48 family metalloprotease [Flavobacteriales bacterium]NQZ35291.1 M48 family metalloprotease [Crocinitomicaceae bacterium]
MSTDQLFFKLNSITTTVLFIAFAAWNLNAQQINLDQFYNSSAPHKSLESSSSKRIDSLYAAYLQEHDIVEDNGSYQEFIYDYNFFLEKLNKSGRVFSGDEISYYLNKLKNEILEGHPKKDLIHVYLTNFDQLNAFTNDFGSIYVNIATVAKIDSEMKLRVILAHEISHVLLRHSFKMANLDNHFSNNKFERINQISDFDSHQFSQMQELEADSMAYGLLRNQGYDISDLESLFDDLSTSRNPVFSKKVRLNELCLSTNPMQLDYLNRIESIIENEELFAISVKEDDSLSTHPSAEARKLLYQRISQDSINVVANKIPSKNEGFDRYRLLAANVLARTLMTEHKYIEGLYLVIQLREKYPDDLNLLKHFLKLQVLVTQSKYMYNESSVLNEYGSSCSDLSFLVFRKGVLSIPALEMNILSTTNIKKAQDISEVPYLNRLSDFSYQFLYKYNPELITKNSEELNLSSVNVNSKTLLKRPLLTTFQKDRYKVLSEDGYLLVDTLVRGMLIIDDFVAKFDQYDQFKKSLYSYRASRDAFEKMLTIDEFIVDFDPDESYKKFRKGESNSVKSISASAVTALVQTDTYVFTRNEGFGVTMDIKKTLEVQDLIAEMLQEEKYFSKDLTNLNRTNGKTSIRDNYTHYLLTNWIGECLNFEDLVYSVADEEIMDYLESSNTEYLVYNFNILNKNKSDGEYRCLYYNLYFDLKTMGVAYVSTIASSKKPKKKYLKHYFHQAHFGKTSL